MEPFAGKILINGASSQLDRWRYALAPDYARVDDRSFAELLDFAIEFARLVQFYDLKNEANGDWVDFFLIDPTVIFASIEATSLGEIDKTFLRLEQQTAQQQHFERKFVLFRQLFEVIARLAGRINTWLSGLDRLPDSELSNLLRNEIRSVITTELSEQLRTLKAYDEGAGLKSTLRRSVGLDYSGFLSIWRLHDVPPDGSIYRVGKKRHDHHDRRVRMIDHALAYLPLILNAFVGAITDWQIVARTNLSTTLDTGRHRPQIALYIAFAKLFNTAQLTVNTFSRRYVHFYYNDVLRQPHRLPVADSVYLTFALADEEDVSRTSIPQDTLFPAGQGVNDNEILYGADKELVVTKAAIAQLRTLHVDRGPLFYETPPSTQPLVVRRILAANPLTTTEAMTESSPDTQSPWPTFGPETADPLMKDPVAKGVEVSSAATLGFVLASTYLLLTGGNRTVELKVNFTHTLDQLLDQLYQATGMTQPDILVQVLEGAFDLFLSTAGGWFTVESYSVSVVDLSETEGNSSSEDNHKPVPNFTLRFTLPPSVPPIVAFNPENAVDEEADAESEFISLDPIVIESNPQPGLPTMKAYLRQTSVQLRGTQGTVDIYRLSIIEQIQVTKLELHTQVQGLANLVLSNTDGEIDTESPFTPFGASPVVGSYLRIGGEELFAKTLERLEITFKWFNLPPNTDGFWGYYRDYVIGLDGKLNKPGTLFNNQSFRGRFHIENPGTWELSDCPDECKLLSQAQGCIEKCLQCLAGDTHSISDTVDQCLIECLKCLVELAWQCLQQCPGLTDDRSRNTLSSLIEKSRTTESTVSESFVYELRDHVRADNTLGEPVVGSPDKCSSICNAILNSIVCIVECWISAEESPDGLTACLLECDQRLNDTYTAQCLGSYLFRTKNDCENPVPAEAEALCTNTRFVFGPGNIRDQSQPPYYTPDQTAIELGLTAPPYAFGNDLYPQNVLNAVIDDLPDADACIAGCEIECKEIGDTATNLQNSLENCLAVDGPRPITAWHIIGPWDKAKDGTPNFDTSQAPDLTATVKLNERELKWQEVRSRDKDGKILLREHFQPNEYTWAMAYTAIKTEHSRTINWQLSGDDQAIVWVNGTKIYDNQGDHRWGPSQATGSVELQRGTNHIWIQSGNSIGQWEFSLAVGTPFRSCLLSGLIREQLRLVQAAVAGLIRCINKCLVIPPPSVQAALRDLEARLRENVKASADEASQHVQTFLRQNGNVIGKDGVRCITRCWDKALKVWEIATRIGDCQTCVGDCNETDRQCQTKCVELCIADLRESYETCLKTCIDNCMKPKGELKYPNEPYLPQTESVTVDYLATCTIPSPSPKQKCERECHVLHAAAVRLEEVRQRCQNLVGVSYQQSLDLGFAEWEYWLLKAFLDCVAQCWGKKRKSRDATYAKLVARVNEYRDLEPAELSRQIQSSLADCRALIARSSGSSESDCLDKCRALLDGLLSADGRMIACSTEMYETYKTCMETGLTGCQERLQRAYERCLIECRKRECLLKCHVLLAAAEQIEQCLSHCRNDSGYEYFECMSGSIAACQRQLLEDGIECILDCVDRCGDQLADGTARRIQECLDLDEETTPADQCRQLNQSLAACREQLGENEARHLDACWGACLHVLEAVLLVEAAELHCRQQMFDAFRRDIETGLARCQNQLDRAFHRCIHECRKHSPEGSDEEHHHHCLKECQILLDAAGWIRHSQEHCADRSGQEYVECIVHSILRCVDRLLHANWECFRHCIHERASELSPEALGKIEGFLNGNGRQDNATTSSEGRQGRLLQRKLNELWNELPVTDRERLAGCRVKCLALLKAAICVEDCLLRSQERMYEPYKPCIENGLSQCKDRLKEQYRACVENCEHRDEMEAGYDGHRSQKCWDECQVLAEAAEWIKQCRDGCHDQSGLQYAECIEKGVADCQKRLLTATIRCFMNCLIRCELTLSADTRQNIESCLQLIPEETPAQQAKRLKESYQECVKNLRPEESSCLTACNRKCWELLDAVLRLELSLLDCQAAMYDRYKQCTQSGLTVCKEQFDQAYLACVARCEANQPKQEPSARYFHLLPFGGFNEVSLTSKRSAPLLPQFSHDGNLYIGFNGLAPPQPLTLLFQMAGDAPSDQSGPLPPVEWDVLTHNRWQPLDRSQVLADSTNGLQNSGIVSLRLPAYDPIDNTLLPPTRESDDEAPVEHQWLRASVKDLPRLFPRTSNLYPHAVLATWRNVDNTGEHLRQPLPAHTITSSVDDLPYIAQIDQPMESFGGRPPDVARSFEIWLGERLRHKDRANLAWDYERLVLERFPTIWKVQTLPARDAQQGNQPGKVLVVVVAGPDSIQTLDPTMPMASGELLGQIHTYLSGLTSPFVQLQVVNPLYVRIKVITTVHFHVADDQGALIDRLNQELIEYLSPWFYDAARAAKGVHYVSKADISEFIQTRPYVSSLLSMELDYDPDINSYEWYFLTSANKHHISTTDTPLLQQAD